MGLLTIEEVARLCRVHEMTVRRHVNEGRLRAVRVGKSLRVREEDLQAYLQPQAPRAAEVNSPPRARALARDDAIFRLIGIVSSEEAAGLSEDKYGAFSEVYYPKP